METRCGSPPAPPPRPPPSSAARSPSPGRATRATGAAADAATAARQSRSRADSRLLLLAEQPLLPRLRRRLRKVLHLQAVIVMPPLAARKHLLRNLLHREIRKIRFPAESRAQHQERPIRPDLIAQLLQLLVTEIGGRDVDEIPFRRMAVLPVHRIAGRVRESLQLAQRLREH